MFAKAAETQIKPEGESPKRSGQAILMGCTVSIPIRSEDKRCTT